MSLRVHVGRPPGLPEPHDELEDEPRGNAAIARIRARPLAEIRAGICVPLGRLPGDGDHEPVERHAGGDRQDIRRPDGDEGRGALPADDHRSRRPGPRPDLRQRDDGVRRGTVGAALDRDGYQPRRADAGQAPPDDGEVRVLPAARTDRRGPAAQPGRALALGPRRRGASHRGTPDAGLPHRAPHHARQHRPERLPRSRLRQTRTDPGESARGTERRAGRGFRAAESRTRGETHREAPGGRDARRDRRRPAPLAAARRVARRRAARTGAAGVEGAHRGAVDEVPRTHPSGAVAGVGGPLRRRPGLSGGAPGTRSPRTGRPGGRRWTK